MLSQGEKNSSQRKERDYPYPLVEHMPVIVYVVIIIKN